MTTFSLRCLVPKTHDLIVYGVLQRLCQFFQTRQRLKIATLAGYINAFKHHALKAFVMPKGVKAFGPTYIGFALLGIQRNRLFIGICRFFVAFKS
jgi:hypothetical protein